jgi:hypothetical protein
MTTSAQYSVPLSPIQWNNKLHHITPHCVTVKETTVYTGWFMTGGHYCKR